MTIAQQIAELGAIRDRHRERAESETAMGSAVGARFHTRAAGDAQEAIDKLHEKVKEPANA